MKRSITFTLTLATVLCFCAGLNAQLLSNKGATLTIEPGATLFVEGGVENIDGGTIDNQGKIELEGNFDNSANYTGTADTVKFSGAGNATLSSGGATIGTLDIGKNSGNNVTLGDDASVGSELAFTSDNTKVILGAHSLAIENDGSITGYDDNNYVVTDGAGSLVIEGVEDGETVSYPVGATTDTYNEAEITGNAGHATDNFGVRVQEDVLLNGTSGDVIDFSVVTASWVVTEGTDGGSDIDLTLYWAMADEAINFDDTETSMARHDGSGWDTEYTDFSATNGTSPDSKTRENITGDGVFAVHSALATQLTNSLIVGPRVYLQGAYDGGADLMRDDIMQDGLIPAEEPYTALGFQHRGLGGGEMVDDIGIFNQPADADDIVDWVFVELRDATEDTLVATKSALINRAGYIVSHTDAVSSVDVNGIPDGEYYLVVRHRNHLAVQSSSTIMLNQANQPWDFTTNVGQAFDSGESNAPMAEVEAGVFGMWGGDVNGNNLVSYVGGGSDKASILAILGAAGNILNDYDVGDVNMNGSVTYVGGGSDKAAVLAILGGAGNILNGHVNN